MAAADPPLDLALIGAGPTTASLLERLVANAEEILHGRALRLHLVDPHRVGTGRVWRPDVDASLWMNSMAEDVTMFTDASVRCEGPIRPGPTLLEWAHSVDDESLACLAPPELVAEIRAIAPMTFPSRRVQSVYLEWFFRRQLAELPAGVEVVVHPARAVDLTDAPDGRQRISLDGDQPSFAADIVVLALGHLDARPDRAGADLERFAAEHGLTYIGPGHTADLDLSALEPGADVIVTGFGQAFTDLAILVSQGRGGRFVERPDGWSDYEASGREPVLHVGSRRGVPYRSKLDYRLQAPLVALPRFLSEDALAALPGEPGSLEFRRDVFPLVAKEVCWAYYHELFAAHAERTRGTWDAFAERYAGRAWGPEIDALVAEAVPDPADRFDFAALDRPLRGLRFASADALQAHLVRHIRADVERRTDPAHSADLAAFLALLSSFGAVGRLAAAGRFTARSRVEDVAGSWFSFFMYYASGPPPARLRQLLALAGAGLLRFIGADTTVTPDPALGRFVARSSSHPDRVVATALVDARIAAASVSRSTDPLLASLLARGEVTEEVVSDGSGWQLNTGKVVVTGRDLRMAMPDGRAHPRRHALGAFTNRPAAGTFSRPNTNAPAFRQNDLVARSILQRLVGEHDPVAASRAPVSPSTPPARPARPAPR